MDNKELDLTHVNEIDMDCAVCDEDDLDGFGGCSENIDARPMKTISATMATHDGYDTLDIHKNFIDTNEDYSNANKIDMEIDSVLLDDDDDSFGGLDIQPTKTTSVNTSNISTGVDGRDYINKTGVMINLSDDEEIKPTAQKINYLEDAVDDDSFGLNDDVPYDDTEDLDNKELVSEEMLSEKKSITQGDVEADYWSKLQKRHKKTNVKGAYNTHFHFAGDPKVEMDDFNHDMKSGPSAVMASGALASNSTAVALGGGEGCCEELEEECVDYEPKIENTVIDYSKLCKALFEILGFDVCSKGNKYVIKDSCGFVPETACSSKQEVFDHLTPYIEDMFILPIQIKTGEPLKTCADCTKWYSAEMQKKHPECAKDMPYLDLVAHHINECNF